MTTPTTSDTRKYYPGDVENPKDAHEVWEITIPGRVWAHRFDRRANTYVPVAVGSNGPKRLRITADDRHYTQEQIPEENRHLDPFNNGVFVQVKNEKRLDEGIDDKVGSVLEVDDASDFRLALESITHELLFRQIRDVVEDRGSGWQREVYFEVFDQKWRSGGTQRTVQELMDAGDMQAGERIS